MITPEIILGPPGTGKTTTLLGIVEDEMHRGTPPDRIGYLSFTRKAADEAISRAATRFSLTRKHFPYFRTLHSLCFRALGLSSGDVLEGKKMEEFGSIVGHKITGKFSLEDGTVFGFEKGDRLMFMENLSRVRCCSLRDVYDEDDDELSFWEVERFSNALRAFKSENNILDYTDMLLQFVQSDIRVNLDVLLVDEAQDLSVIQWQVVHKLAQRVRRLVIAGDDDQAIYRWAGADVDTLVNMEGSARVLTQSWRVPRDVQSVASDIVNRIRHRREKFWLPRDEQGSVRWHAHQDSIDLEGKDILILARNRYILREYEKSIKSMGYLYEFQGARSIRPSVLDAVLTWERLRQGKPGVTGADCKRMYDQLSMGVGYKRGSKTLPQIAEEEEVNISRLIEAGGLLVDPNKLWYDALDRLSIQEIAYIRAARRRGEDLLAPPRIRLSTIHGMKGGEGERVILLTDMASRTYEESLKMPDDEARVWYVALTRARQELSIIAPKTAKNYKL